MGTLKTFGSHLVDFSIIPDNGVFIDAGACQGNFMDDIIRNNNEPIIFALEPNKTNAHNLHDRVKHNIDITLFESALVGSGEPKKMKFADFTSVGLPEWGNVSGLYESRNPKHYDVDTIDIHELLGFIPYPKIHHLKMDIEGCEHKVIKDLTEDDAKRIQQISLEVHNGLQGMLDHLTKIGYDAKFENGELYATTSR
jgi:FkbM family methyltransferase